MTIFLWIMTAVALYLLASASMDLSGLYRQLMGGRSHKAVASGPKDGS